MADNTTRLKILAQVEGVQGFDSLKRSLQGLAQQGQQSGRSLDRLYTSYQQLSGAGKNSISSLRLQATALAQLRDQAELGSRKFRILTQDLERVEKQLQQTTRATRGAAPAMGGGMGLAGLAGQFAPQLAVGAAVAGVATAGVSAESAQVRLKALTDQFGEYNEAQAAAARIAGTLRLSTAESQQSFADLYASLRPTGITVKELEDTLIGFSAAARNSGATAQETSNALIQLKQGLASGALQGEELRSIREQAPLAAQAIAKEMGTTIGNLKNLAAEGKVTTDVVIRAMGRLKEEQLGKLNAQFNTAEQAMTDMKNAALDAGSEISKLFGPTMVAGLRLLTGALKGVNDQLKFYSDTQAALKNYNITPEQELKIRQKADKEAEDIVNRRRIANPFQRNEEYQRVRQEQYKNMIERFRYGSAGLQSKDFALTPEQLADQAAARQERLQAELEAKNGKKGKKTVQDLLRLSDQEIAAAVNTAMGEYGGGDPRGRTDVFANILARSRSGQYPRNLVDVVTQQGQYAPNFGLSRAQVINPNRFGRAAFERTKEELMNQALLSQSIQDIDSRLYFKGISEYPNMMAGDFLRARGQNFFHGPGRESGRNPRITTQLLSELGGSSAVAGYYDELSSQAQEQQKLAEQRAKEQKDTIERNQKLAEQAQQQQDSYFASLQTTKDQARLLGTMTEGQRLLEEFANNILDIERDTAKAKAEALTEDAAALAVADGELKKQNALNKLYQDQAALKSELMDFSSTNSIMQSSISAELQKQTDAMERQRNMAEGIASTIGQGFSQAFDLAIQGSEDWKRSLSEIASGVLRDIAKQLIEIAVINTITKAVTGMISPTPKPTQNVPGYGSAGFLGVGTLPQGSNMPLDSVFSSPDFPAGFVPQFATGGIMTPQGAVPLRRYARGGIATAPQAAIYGEGATPEAFVPLPDGRRIPVALRQYPGIPGAPGTSGSFEQTDAVVQRLVETARQESAVRAATGSAAGPDGTMRIQIETTRINSVDYVTAEQAQALAQAAATRSTARQQRALQGSPAARRSVGI